MRVFLLLFCCLPALGPVAAKGRWIGSGSAYGGLPVFRSVTGPDNFFLKNYDAVAAFNLGAYYRTATGWQFGLLGSVNILFTNRSKTEASIIQIYSGAGFLHKISIGEDPVTGSLMAEAGKVFEAGKWSVTPFFRSSIVYACSTGPGNNFSLKQKVPNEHYYKETYWEFSDSSQQVKFAPLQLAGGLRLGYQLWESCALYLAMQYQFGTVTLEGMQRQTDFYGEQNSTPFRMQQQYSVLGLELGLHINMFDEP